MNFDFYTLSPEEKAHCLNHMRQNNQLSSYENDASQLEALFKMVSAARFEIQDQKPGQSH